MPRGKKRGLLIEPSEKKSVTKAGRGSFTNKQTDRNEVVMPGNPTFSTSPQEIQADLEKIVRGEDLPISKETRAVEDENFTGFHIRRTCSDRQVDAADSEDFQRWNAKMNRSVPRQQLYRSHVSRFHLGSSSAKRTRR